MSCVPTIDLGPLFAGDSAAARRIDAAIGTALADQGGFAISGFPGAADIDGRAAVMMRFFELGESEKRAVATRAYAPEGKRTYRGYSAHEERRSWAHTEMFDIGPEVPVPGPALKGVEVFAETNIWPDREPVAGWRAAMRSYHADMERVSRGILSAVGRVVGVPETRLEEKFRDGNSTLRLLNYPPHAVGATIVDPNLAQADAPPLLARRHTDASGLSLLWQGGPGLQAEGPDGAWHDIPAAPTGISVHLGTTLEMMTEGRVRATPHRVLDHGAPRHSIGFFLEPGLAQRLAPVTGDTVPDSTDADPRGTYGWHLMERFSSFSDYAGLVPPPEMPTP